MTAADNDSLGLSGRWRIAIGAALVIAALGIGASGMGYALKDRALSTAIRLAPGNARIRGEYALERFESAGNPAARAAARGEAERALRRDPTIVSALSTIGLNAQASGDAASARRIFTQAERLSRRDLQGHLWWIEHAAARGDTQAVLRHYDLALRTSAVAGELLFPILASAVEDVQIRTLLADRLRTRPAWTDPFLRHLVESDTDLNATSALLARVKSSGQALPPGVEPAMLLRLVQAGQYAGAWRFYAAGRANADRDRVRNASFADAVPDPTIFDWSTRNEGSVASDIIVDGENSRLAFGVGAAASGLIAQQLQFPSPGSFRIVSDVRSLQTRGGGVYWTLTCADASERTRLSLTARVGTQRSATFDVPADCGAAWLKLMVTPTDAIEGIDGEIGRVTLEAATGR